MNRCSGHSRSDVDMADGDVQHHGGRSFFANGQSGLADHHAQNGSRMILRTPGSSWHYYQTDAGSIVKR